MIELRGCGPQPPGETCSDVRTLFTDLDLLPLGLGMVAAIVVTAVIVVLLHAAIARLRRRARS